ncbi:MAG: peptidoglycan-binding domain-containing protein [Candidatus Binatia bacterium]
MATSSEDVRRLQQSLRDKGFDPGPINGVMGPKTQQAVRAFQQRQGLNATGTLDAQTRTALGIGQPGPSRPGVQQPGSGGASAGTSVEPAVPRDPSVKPGEPLPPANQGPRTGTGSAGSAGGR